MEDIDTEESAELHSLASNLIGVSTRLSVQNILNADDTDIWDGLDHDNIFSQVLHGTKDLQSSIGLSSHETGCDSVDEEVMV